jgi:hypothetical protein
VVLKRPADTGKPVQDRFIKRLKCVLNALLVSADGFNHWLVTDHDQVGSYQCLGFVTQFVSRENEAMTDNFNPAEWITTVGTSA